MKTNTLLYFPVMKYSTWFAFIAMLTFMISAVPANASGNINDIQQVAEAGVKGCTHIANVQGYSGYGKPSRTFWKERGKHKALQSAADLNATHVVWDNDLTGYGSGPRIYGEAYDCNTPERMANAKHKK